MHINWMNLVYIGHVMRRCLHPLKFKLLHAMHGNQLMNYTYIMMNYLIGNVATQSHST